MNAVAEKQVVAGLPEIGAPLSGGFFAGIIKVAGALRALIVAPKDGGETNMEWAAESELVTGSTSYCDGAENTAAMTEAGSELGKWAKALQINGQADWYLPSRDELELIYRNLKPSQRENYCSFRDGDNPSSEPPGYPYTEQSPKTTTASHFREGGAEALAPNWYWSSTQHAAYPSYAWVQGLVNGYQSDYLKSYEGRARAVRSIPI